MIARTNRNGEVVIDSAREPLLILFKRMKTILRQDEKIQESGFTKSYLQRTFQLTAREATDFINSLEKEKCLGTRDKIENGKGWYEKAYVIVNPPQAPSSYRPPNKGERFGWKKKSRMSGSQLCGRCGAIIQGRGRHNKKEIGHTREVCDLSMVRVIQDY